MNIFLKSAKPGYVYFLCREFNGDYRTAVNIKLTIDELKEIHKKMGQYIQEMEK